MRRLDLTGKTFGNLEVLSFDHVNENGATVWRCLCHRCGKQCLIVGHRLTDKKQPYTDCGCGSKWKEDLTGQTIGALQVLKHVKRANARDKIYLCRCTLCGREKEFTAGTIRSGSKGCGCLQYTKEHMSVLSKAGTKTAIIDGVNVRGVFKESANKTSQTGVRGVVYVPKRGTYTASCQVHGERWIKAGFTSVESAKAARDEAQQKLIKKYNVQKPEKFQKSKKPPTKNEA